MRRSAELERIAVGARGAVVFFNLSVSKIFSEIPKNCKPYSKTTKGLFFEFSYDVEDVLARIKEAKFLRQVTEESFDDFQLERSKAYSLKSCGRRGAQGITVRFPNYSVSEPVEPVITVTVRTIDVHEPAVSGARIEATLEIHSVGLTSSRQLSFADSHTACAHIIAVHGILKNCLKTLGNSAISVKTDSDELLSILQGDLAPTQCFVSALSSFARTTGSRRIDFTKVTSDGRTEQTESA